MDGRTITVRQFLPKGQMEKKDDLNAPVVNKSVTFEEEEKEEEEEEEEEEKEEEKEEEVKEEEEEEKK